MPLKNFKNVGDLQTFEYLKGKITGVNTNNDTCDITIGDDSYSSVPIFFHCDPDAEEQDNGSLKGAAAAFRTDDDVVVLIERDADTPKIFVVARIGEKRYCLPGITIIISTQTGAEAFAWDLKTDTLAIEVATLSSVVSQIGTAGDELVPSGSVDDEWEREDTAYFSEYDATMNLPILINGDYPDDGLEVIDTVPYPAIPEYNFFGNISKWSFTHYYIDNPFDTEAEPKAPYLMLLYGVSEDGGKDEFEELTGCTWTPDADPSYDNPIRQYLFWNSVFGYNIDGDQAILENLEEALEPFYDSWAEGIWEPVDGDVCDALPVAPYRAVGIAQKNNAAVLFEHAGLCVNWDSGTCSDPETTYSSILRIYLRNDDYLQAGLAKGCFDAVNVEREAIEVTPLALNTILCKTAERHLADVLENFMSMSSNGTTDLPHTGSDSSTPFTRATEEGYVLWKHAGHSYTIGENIHYHYNVPEEPDHVSLAIEGWRASTEGHWEMLTNSDMKETGVAFGTVVVEFEEGIQSTVYVFVQVFGVREEIWPGFSPADTTNLKAYMEENFTFTATGDETRVPKVYLI